jgi:phage anti-repressor protein
MTGLIPLAQRFIAGHSIPTVSARKLHEFLKVGRDFTNWIKNCIQQYGFVENHDFILIR